MKESIVLKKVWLALAKRATLFRLNTGQAWLGGRPERLADGTVAIPYGRPVAVGLGHTNGSSVVGAADLIGWTTVKVTDRMVGSKIAIFTSIETKREKSGKISPDQIKWSNIVLDSGGISLITNSDIDAKEKLEKLERRYDKSIRTS